MINLQYKGIIETDVNGEIVQPIIVLSTRSGHKIGVIENVQHLVCNHPMNDTAEISFDVYKEVNGKKNLYWEQIKDFKFIYLPTVKDMKYRWYEIVVNLDEDDDTIKHITGIHANEAELGQLMLYEVEINTADDIARDDYELIEIDGKEYGTVFYNPEHPKASLLHRLLSDKASYYEIQHVDDTLKNIQREFSFNGVSIVDALRQNVAQEIGCFFVFGEYETEDNEYHRTISAYDLMDYCIDCGERGTYTEGHCIHCNSTNIHYGFGDDSGIFINVENIADSISYSSDTDSVKNFFRLKTGDDYMDAAVRNCNPNGSDYLFYFSDDMKEDMSDELSQKLNEYESLYNDYFTSHEITLPNDNISSFNELVDTYSKVVSKGFDFKKIENPIIGYSNLTEAYYISLNFKDLLNTTMMLGAEDVQDTDAQTQLNHIMNNISPIGTLNTSVVSQTSADNAVESYAKVFLDVARYKITLENSSYVEPYWNGIIKVESYTDSEDVAEITVSEKYPKGILFNNDGAAFFKQKIEKTMKERETQDIGDVSFLQWDLTKDHTMNEFKERLKSYSLDSLLLLESLCTAVLDILADANQGSSTSQYYNQFYKPYYDKQQEIIKEEIIREKEIDIIDNVIDSVEKERDNIQTILDIQDYFGDLYTELSLYRRETEYTNSNFISDNFTDAEVIDNARKFFNRAKEELIKASTIQHSISAPLYNFMLLPEFRMNSSTIDLNKYQMLEMFISGNWIRMEVDDKVYKLRMTNWEIDYESPENLDVEFSDAIYTGNTISDVASVLSKARSMATTYDAVTRQAEKGNTANITINETKKNGLILDQNKIINNANRQTFVIDSQGALLRGLDDFDGEFTREQIKLLNRGIYYTNDNWETVQAGLGRFTYIDPDTGQEVEDYGVIASTIVGKLILGNNLRIFSENGSLRMDENGFVIDTTDAYEGNDIFTIQKTTPEDGTVKYLYVDGNGNVVIRGTTVSIEDLQGNTLGLIDFVDKTVDDALPIEIRVESSRGIVFKNKGVNTILTATVFKGNNDITDKVKKFIWTKYDGEGILDTSWSRELSGNSIVISSADVTRSARFCCSVEF